MSAYVCMHTMMCVCKRACQYIYIYMCVCVCVFACPHAGLYVKGSHSAARDVFRKSLLAVSSTLQT